MTDAAKKKEAEELRKHVEEFLAKGGEIQQVPIGVRTGDTGLTDKQKTIVNRL